ncbi:MAG: E3 ubiquitin ligase family protein [Pseudomonadota bacterium]|nr:E3 ubiquitin ligase family protein [Pseudomonadota bacterium]
MLHYWLGAVALGAVAVWALCKCFASVRRDRILADTPLVKIRSAAQGYVKVIGRAKPAGEVPTTAPLSARPCVWWSYEIEEKVTNSRNESHWESVASGTSVEPFALADADGECLVGPVNAEITPTSHDRWSGERPNPTCLPLQARGLLGTDNYRYTERLLSVGDLLSVTGELRSNSEIQTADAAAVALLREWKHDQAALLGRFDRNHDGRIDSTEWEAARRAAMAQSQGAALSSPIVRTSVIGQPMHGEPFLIAPMDSAHLVLREKMTAVMFLILGIVCTGLCAWSVERAQGG